MINVIRDIRDRQYYTIRTKEDFMNADYGSRPPTYVDSLPLAMNQWTYLDEIKAMRIKTDDTTHGWVRINLGELEVGDIINVSVEVFNISGEKSKISIEAIGGGSQEISSEKNNEWEILQLKYIVRKDTIHSLYVGIWRDDVGEFMMRNIKCEVLSQRKLTPYIIESGENQYGSYIKFSDGTMICRGKLVKTGIIDNEWGGLYYIEIGQQPYPQPFVEPPEIAFACVGHRSFFINSYFSQAATDDFKRQNTPKVEGYRPVADTQEWDYEVSYIAIGRWK